VNVIEYSIDIAACSRFRLELAQRNRWAIKVKGP